MRPSGDQAPTSGMIAEIVAKVRPDLERLFQRHWVTAEEAEALLDEAVLSLALRWDRVDDPALWLAGAVDKAIQRRLLIPVFH